MSGASLFRSIACVKSRVLVLVIYRRESGEEREKHVPACQVDAVQKKSNRCAAASAMLAPHVTSADQPMTAVGSLGWYLLHLEQVKKGADFPRTPFTGEVTTWATRCLQQQQQQQPLLLYHGDITTACDDLQNSIVCVCDNR